MIEVRPEESTLPTAGNRIWGNCTGLRIVNFKLAIAMRDKVSSNEKSWVNKQCSKNQSYGV